MSTDAASTPVKEKHHKKHKEHKEKKSKKRAHDDAAAVAATPTTTITTSSSPTKKRRTAIPPPASSSSSSSSAAAAVNTPADTMDIDAPTTSGAQEDGHNEQGESSGSNSTSLSTTYTVPEINLENTPLATVTASFYVPLAPIAERDPIPGLCAEHLSPLLLTYYPPLKGIVLSYENARMSEEPVVNGTRTTKGNRSTDDEENADSDSDFANVALAHSIGEYAAPFLWLTADLTFLRPLPGTAGRRPTVLEGHVNLQNESHLGLVCYNLFNASIARARLPPSWRWIDDAGQNGTPAPGAGGKGGGEEEGHYVDARGVRVGGLLRFWVRDFEATPAALDGSGDRGFVAIEGSLLHPDAEKELDRRERAEREKRRAVKGATAGAGSVRARLAAAMQRQSLQQQGVPVRVRG